MNPAAGVIRLVEKARTVARSSAMSKPIPQEEPTPRKKKKKLKIPYGHIAQRAGFWLFVSGLSLYLLSPNYFSRLVNQAVAGVSGGLLQPSVSDETGFNR